MNEKLGEIGPNQRHNIEMNLRNYRFPYFTLLYETVDVNGPGALGPFIGSTC
jgi:hypothetical protein